MRTPLFLILCVLSCGCANPDGGAMLSLANGPEAAKPVAAMSEALNLEIPAGYYDSVNQTSAALLRSTLHDVIDDHTKFPYTSTKTDTWDILDQDGNGEHPQRRQPHSTGAEVS